MANRLKSLLPRLVGEEQSAFVKGRNIGDNILLAHELCHNMHLDVGRGRMCLQPDLRKAYDSLSWDFLDAVLERYAFPSKWRRWVKACVRASFVVNVNGKNSDSFVATNGLRQGDPMAPYLFVLSMEVLSTLIKEEVAAGRLTPLRCGRERISHLLFADDVMVFAEATQENAITIKRIMDKFEAMSGLRLNTEKSNLFLGGDHREKEWIAEFLQMKPAALPVRYLGLPLISSRLSKRHCQTLVEKVRAKLSEWRRGLLSMAGRGELVRSVLVSFSVFWTSAFYIPRSILYEIEHIMSHFIWGGEKKMVLVSWKDICTTKQEGGLGLRRLTEWNDAGLLRLFWLVAANQSSLWVKAIRSKYLRNKSVWHARPPTSCSWAWRGVLRLQAKARETFFFEIGDGTNVRFFEDPWCGRPFICEEQGSRFHYDMGVPMDTRVSYFLGEEGWRLPFPKSHFMEELWQRVRGIKPTGGEDVLCWEESRRKAFSLKAAWKSIRREGPRVGWSHGVWHSLAIPRVSLCVWRAMRNRLPTMDLLWARHKHVISRFALCKCAGESVDHLFWECSFSKEVWHGILDVLRIRGVGSDVIHHELERIISASRTTMDKHMARLAYGSTIYLLWQERNLRVLVSDRASLMVHNIKEMVRLKATTSKRNDHDVCEEIRVRWL